MKDKILEICLNKLTQKHKYFHSQSGDVHEVVVEKDFEQIANAIASEIAGQFTLIAEGEVEYDSVDGGYTRVGDVWLGQLGKEYDGKKIQLILWEVK